MKFLIYIALAILVFMIVRKFFMKNNVKPAPPTHFIIPANFEGKVIVFYDYPNGSAGKVHEGVRVIEIQDDGTAAVDFTYEQVFLDITDFKY